MLNLKLLTLNLHCLEEEYIPMKQLIIIDEIIQRDIDVIFLQEVAQYLDSPLINGNIKESNYAYQLQQLLLSKGKQYHLYYSPIKEAFDKYDEGVAVLSKYPLYNVKDNYISKCTEYKFWRTRKMLKGDFQRHGNTVSFVSTHLGWTDHYETFEDQVERLITHLDNKNTIIVAGDFNVAPTTKEYGYLLSKGLKDLYGANPKYVLDPTHISNMDVHSGSTRIDYIFSNTHFDVVKREILFKEKRVSDHYGVYLEIKL